MLKTAAIALRYFCFWLLFFFIDRLIFILYFTGKLKEISFNEIITSFLYGLWMDASMAGYICAVPLLIFVASWLVPTFKVPAKIPRLYTKTLIILFSLLTIINFNIYREWGSKINYRAFEFAFSGPGEALASSASSPVFSSLLIFIGFAGLSLFLAKKIISYSPPPQAGIVAKAGFSLLFIGLNFLAIRGNIGVAPMNESMAYFSDKPIMNHAAVNTEWTLFHDLLRNKKGRSNPYNYYSNKESESIVNELYTRYNNHKTKILTTDRPNIVLIILESFTADVIESLGGEKGVAPNMEKLIAGGVLFSNTYASGDRTEKGIASVLSGFPAQAIQSIMKDNNKQEKLPSLSQELAGKGYHTSFYYGGESEFANMKSYILSHSYQRLVDKNTYAKKDMNSKWGAYDEVVFREQLKYLNKEPRPFFSTLMTLSNHEPFELPVKLHFGSNTLENKFRSTVYYTDSVIADYLVKAQKQPWYKNTLFIIVADHGHRLPTSKYENYHPSRFRIPLLFYGDVIKPEYRGKRIEKIGNQTDIAATLLQQLNINSSSFKWSKDLLSPASKDFSFFNWDNGFGFVMPGQIVSFDNVGRKVIYKQNSNVSADSLLRYGKAYMQSVYGKYLEY